MPHPPRAAGWGGAITEPGVWHRGHQGWVIKLSVLGCQYSLCAAFGAEDSFGRVAAFSATVVLLLGLLQWLLVLVTGPCGSLCIVNKLSISSDTSFSACELSP